MIKLENGHTLEFLAASGALGFDGRGWPWEWPARWAGMWDPADFTIVLKTLTYRARRGNLRWHNPHRVVKWVPGGTVNSIGLTNPGLLHWAEHVAPQLDPRGRFIVSITSNDAAELEAMGKILGQLPNHNIVGVEFNASCPNSPNEAELLNNAVLVRDLVVALYQSAESFRRRKLALLLKLSAQQDYCHIAELCQYLVQAITPNAVPWHLAYPTYASPLHKKFGSGGVSGLVAQGRNWKMIGDLLTLKLRHVGIVGSSVWRYRDLVTLHDKGVGAVAFGSLFIKYPWNAFCPSIPNRYVEQWRAEYRQF